MSSIYTKSYARTTRPMDLPTLIDVQLRSFEQFTSEGVWPSFLMRFRPLRALTAT
jgi:hypothetical protein